MLKIILLVSAISAALAAPTFTNFFNSALLPASEKGTYPPASPTNPGGRYSSATWLYGSQKRMYFFGGFSLNSSDYGLFNDLWYMDTTTGVWKYIDGPQTSFHYGIYTGANKWPGGRKSAHTWVSGRSLYMFGGEGYATYNHGQLADFWRYDLMTGTWAFLGGSENAFPIGVYTGSAQWPGGRSGGAAWVDGTYQFWLYGGYGRNGSAVDGYLTDMWCYTVSSNTWKYVTGSGLQNQQAVTTIPLQPASKAFAHSWKDHVTGKLYLFGGYGTCYTSTTPSRSNDVWTFTPSATIPNSGYWSWVAGNLVCDEVGVWSGSSQYISARQNGLTWYSENRRQAIIFGGEGKSQYGTGRLYDVWTLDIATLKWNFIAGGVITNVCNITASPSARHSAVGCFDPSSTNRFWLYGGVGCGGGTSYGSLRDQWTFTY